MGYRLDFRSQERSGGVSPVWLRGQIEPVLAAVRTRTERVYSTQVWPAVAGMRSGAAVGFAAAGTQIHDRSVGPERSRGRCGTAGLSVEVADRPVATPLRGASGAAADSDGDGFG